MDVTRLLEADHRQVEDLMDRIDEAEGDERRPLVEELVAAVRGHMELEEKVVYPAIEPVVGAETVEEGENEHALARKGLDDLVAMAPDEPGFGAALEMVRAGIAHHVEEEEGDVFPKARDEGAEALREAEAPFLAMRRDLGLPIEPHAYAEASTKDELDAQAADAGVEGRSSMSKDELADAVISAAG